MRRPTSSRRSDHRPGATEVRFNSEWLAELDFAEILRLTRTARSRRLLERDDFAKRFAAREPISVSELLYPLMQAYDSVAVDADVELGGTDQLYNLLAGRMVMEAYGLEPQVVLTTPLLLSWDGAKMSSSVGNNIPLTAPPEEQFGRTMRIPDTQLSEWYTLVLEREPPAGEPMAAKLALARAIAARSHGDEAATAAEAHFTRVVREGGAPDDISETPLPEGDPVHLPAAAGDGLRSLDERGATVDRPGRRQARRRGRPRARRSPRDPPRRDPAGRQATLRRGFASPPTLDSPSSFATVLGRPRGSASKESPSSTNRSASRPDRIRSGT